MVNRLEILERQVLIAGRLLPRKKRLGKGLEDEEVGRGRGWKKTTKKKEKDRRPDLKVETPKRLRTKVCWTPEPPIAIEALRERHPTRDHRQPGGGLSHWNSPAATFIPHQTELPANLLSI